MLFIFGKNISIKKNIVYSLSEIFGLNKNKSKIICKNIGLNSSTRIELLTENKIRKLIKYIDKNFIIEQDLKKKILNNKKRLLAIKNYRGLRNILGLPSKGQRTKTNAKTKKKLKKINYDKNFYYM